MPEGEGIREGILRGIYRFKAAEKGNATLQLFGSGPILNEVLKAQQILAEKYNIAADVWSVPSYTELRRDALETERWNRLHPGEPERKPFVLEALGDAQGPIIAASDYIKSLPDGLSPWLGSRLVTLGTDGFGRSDNREHLRSFFEVDAAAHRSRRPLQASPRRRPPADKAREAFAELGIDTRPPQPRLRLVTHRDTSLLSRAITHNGTARPCRMLRANHRRTESRSRTKTVISTGAQRGKTAFRSSTARKTSQYSTEALARESPILA